MQAYKGRLEGTTISVDNFRRNICITHYFLTHGHSDHCIGLTPTWNFNCIYTTATTKHYILNKYKIHPSIFIVLEVGVRRIINIIQNNNSNSIELNDANTDIPLLSFAVTPIPANHCPGAVMFLFEGYFGRILYTGDFRYNSGIFDGYPVFDVDRLYLDDSYCAPFYDHFLNTEECADAIQKIIQKNIGRKVMIAVYSLGKECLFIHISRLLKTLIVVNKLRYKRLKLFAKDLDIEIEQYFTTDEDNGYIFMVNKREVSLNNLDRLNIKLLNNSQQQSSFVPTFIGIVPSGWSTGKKPLRISQIGTRMYALPYSSHSSFNELKQCIKELHPRSIIPIVDDQHSIANQCFRHLLSKTKPVLFSDH